MSPYQTAVKDAALTEFDAQKLRDQQKLQFDALQAGAFGGGRHGLAESDFLTQSALDRQRIASGNLRKYVLRFCRSINPHLHYDGRLRINL